VDHLGTLLKVDKAVGEAIEEHEKGVRAAAQGELQFGDGGGSKKKPSTKPPLRGFEETKATVLGKLERFLAQHMSEAELGIRLDGEQLAAGLRFVRVVREETYDLVIGNPPYQATSKMADSKGVGAKDLYAAFLERGLELARPGGMSAMLTMRGWMFLGQFAEQRERLLRTYDLRSLGDVDRGAFEDVPNEVLAAAMSVFRRAPPSPDVASVAMQPTPLSDKSYDRERTNRKRAAVLAQVGRFEFETRGFREIEGEPLVYWWDSALLSRYAESAKLGRVSPVRQGLGTRSDVRFIRQPWEVAFHQVLRVGFGATLPSSLPAWVPVVKGAEGRVWFEPLADVLLWRADGLEVRTWIEEYRKRAPGQYIKSEAYYFLPGVAFVMIGSEFSGRAHRFRSIFGEKGSSVFPADISGTLCLMNTSVVRAVLESLNPTICFQVGDVNRLPIFPVESASDIYATLDRAFTEHEAARETSVEYLAPGPSPWTYAQAWAQLAVDRPPGAPLPPYSPVHEPAEPVAFVSHAFGLAIGRFPLAGAPPQPTLPAGILYLSAASERDSLADPACAPLRAAWAEHGAAVDPKLDLRAYLRTRFFEHHRKLYESRPIYFPLSSAKRSFVAWISIHRWTEATLSTLLADHLLPERRALEGQLDDLRKARASTDAKQRGAADKRFGDVQKLHEELCAFVDLVTACAEKGPPPPGAAPEREADARSVPDLDDGVMVNSAALWPLLDPQWKDPKKWWKELASASGQKDYDWSHLAARYFPTRVDAKCRKDPSLAVAHGCFWRYHPARAYAWELRLQDEIAAAFKIEEAGSDEARARFLRDEQAEARRIEEAERKRRKRKAEKAGKGEEEEQGALPFGEDGDDGEAAG
jgi:hypothetical protein